MSCTKAFSLFLFISYPRAAVQSPVLLEAQRISRSVTSTSYSHKAVIDESAGIYRVDCSHFVGIVLAHVAPIALRQIPKEPKFKYPRAFSFCDFFRGLGPDDAYWTSIRRLSDAAPGDIIAWRVTELRTAKDTGHVAILVSAPERLDDASYRIEVIDASEVRHFADSRKDGESGVGTGRLQIKVDDNGEPCQVKFNGRASWHAHLFGIGRLKG